MKNAKAYEELELKDYFMFSVIMRNPKYVKPFLETILGIKIAKIEYPDSQKSIDVSAGSKGIRLDVYVEDDKHTVFNLEMQTTGKRDLPKRMRNYQGMMDLNILEKGEDYRNLKKSYVIFICTFDQYGKGVSDAFTQDLEEAVQSVRQNEKWRLDYMTLQQEYRERYEEGKIEGRLEGKIEGKIEGRLEGKIEILYTGFHMTPSQIADKLSLPESEVLRILAELQE